MPELIPVLTEKEIHEKVGMVAQQISKDYEHGQLVLIGVLKGAFVFMADLARRLSIPVEIDFIRYASYGDSNFSSGDIRLCSDITTDIQGKDVLVVEDIIDSGLTMATLIKHLKTLHPESIRICAFIDKYERRKIDCQADYVCHSVEGGFLVGYGLDYAEQYRNLPALYHLNY
ncbi:MAG: hypoxanthine phosphoribosyltransferase [Desulfobacteraceae bacterium]|nr:MAG: hypoxanthine phosphoribosyltransferase [Desulfobacteraceae bacterium]